jgi:hypothetical protein
MALILLLLETRTTRRCRLSSATNKQEPRRFQWRFL